MAIGKRCGYWRGVCIVEGVCIREKCVLEKGVCIKDKCVY